MSKKNKPVRHKPSIQILSERIKNQTGYRTCAGEGCKNVVSRERGITFCSRCKT